MENKLKNVGSGIGVGVRRVAIVVGLLWLGLVISLVNSGCKVSAYDSSNGDSDESQSADDGSVINDGDVAVGGDATVDDGSTLSDAGSVGVELGDGDGEPGGMEGRLGEIECSDFVFPDGEGGNLIRPESNSDGNLAIVFDSEFTPVGAGLDGELGSFAGVSVFRTEGDEDGVEEELTFAGYEGDSERQVWRGEFEGDAYDGRIKVDVGNGTGLVCLIVIDEGLGNEID